MVLLFSLWKFQQSLKIESCWFEKWLISDVNIPKKSTVDSRKLDLPRERRISSSWVESLRYQELFSWNKQPREWRICLEFVWAIKKLGLRSTWQAGPRLSRPQPMGKSTLFFITEVARKWPWNLHYCVKSLHVKFHLNRDYIPKIRKKQLLFCLNVIKRKVDLSCWQLKYYPLNLLKQVDDIFLPLHRKCEGKR